jgi:hypothetical protein
MNLLLVLQRTSVCHVDVEYGNSEGEVVLVEDSLEFGIE